MSLYTIAKNYKGRVKLRDFMYTIANNFKGRVFYEPANTSKEF